MRMEITSENGEKCEEGTQVYFGGWKEGKNHHIRCKLGVSVQTGGVLGTYTQVILAFLAVIFCFPSVRTVKSLTFLQQL